MAPSTKAARLVELQKLQRSLAREKAKSARQKMALAEALARQQATAEILDVIRRSPTDVQPVFDAIVRSAVRMCDAVYSAAMRLDEGLVHLVATNNWPKKGLAIARRLFPMPLDSDHLTAIAIRENRIIHRDHMQDDSNVPATSRELAIVSGYQALLIVPMVRGEHSLGAIVVARKSAFADDQIALLKIFADQAAIAIENARLLKELHASDERYDIAMRAINEGVYDWNIAEDTIYYSERVYSAVGMTPDDYRTAKDWRDRIHPEDLPRYDKALVAHLKGRTERFECDYRFRAKDGSWHWARQHGIAVRDAKGRAIRLIGSTGDITELKQAEEELRRAHEETKEALERQTATAEILKVISSSPTDVQPVFEAIVQRGLKLFSDAAIGISIPDGDKLQTRALAGADPGRAKAWRDTFPIPLSREYMIGAAILDRKVVDVPDCRHAPPELGRGAKNLEAMGYRAQTVMPMMRGDAAIGAISVIRVAPGPLTAEQIGVLKTFTDQAVIAIENVRLFNETKEALERQTATADILKVISSSPTDIQPVLDAVAANAARLCNASDAIIQLREGEVFRFVAHHGTIPNMPLGATREISRELVTGRAFLEARQIHVHDLQSETEEYPQGSVIAKQFGYRTILVTPLMREGAAIGTIMVRRTEALPFSDSHRALVKTFADQAVIAIENVRLFNETKEALERQTATGEILSSISGSMTDAKPVFDAIVRNLLRLFGTRFAAVVLVRDGKLEMAGIEGEQGYESLLKRFPVPVDEQTLAGRVALAGEVMQFAPMVGNPAVPPASERFAREFGFNSQIAAPMIREGKVIGVIVTAHRDAMPFNDKQIALLKTFADQAVIAIENARLFNETKEALERQTATAEILRVISSSPTDTQPVFDAILHSATRLCDAETGILFRYEGGAYQAIATRIPDPEYAALFKEARRPGPKSGLGRLAKEKRPVHIPDILEDDAYREGDPLRLETARLGKVRTWLGAPMLKEGELTGAIVIYRKEPRAFGDQQISLLQTFADQAVIAIENVRLFNETKESLEQQTAISEILRVISSSPTDVQPVLESVAQRAARICDASDARIFLVEGERARNVAGFGDVPLSLKLGDTIPLDRGLSIGRAVLDRAPLHIEDMQAVPSDEMPLAREFAERSGWHTVLVVPLLREARALGAIILRRLEVRPFTDKQIALLKTFADQAAIAIENVRLFNETKEALERQTATAEILKVISGSPTDVQPVFDAIVRSAVQLCSSSFGIVFRFDGKQLHVMAHKYFEPEVLNMINTAYPMAPSPDQASGRAILGRAVAEIPDTEKDSTYRQQIAKGVGFRSTVGIPMLRDGVPLGAIVVAWKEPSAYTAKQIDLLKTFADQAVIAIENVRLFNETKEALERQKASAEVLRVISGSVEDTRPVFEAIVASCARLFAGDSIGINLVDEQGRVHLMACEGRDREALHRYFAEEVETRRGSDLVLKRGIAHFPDIEAPEVPAKIRDGCRVWGAKAIVYAPMVSAGRGIGAIWVSRERVGPFSDKEIALLTTFADQAVIAIQNARLFNETKEALEQQTATAEVLASISGSMTDTQPVFERIVQNVRRLFGTRFAVLQLLHDGIVEMSAVAGDPKYPGFEKLRERYPRPLDDTTVGGRAMLSKQAFQLAPVLDNPATPTATVQFARDFGFNSVIFAPMIHEAKVIGAIGAAHPGATPFDERQVALIKTFADQAVIAIENVRLFNETRVALERQTAISEILRVISSSPTDLRPVYQTILENTTRLCESNIAALFLFDGKVLTAAALHGVTPEFRSLLENVRAAPSHATTSRLAALEKRVVHVSDLLSDPTFSPTPRELYEKENVRTVLSVPMLRKGELTGVITTWRRDVRPFSDRQVALIQTFADQAVIAIENVRLFNETKEALERQTATSEILRVISSSPRDLRPVFDAILEKAMHLCEAHLGMLSLSDGDKYEHVAQRGASPEFAQWAFRGPFVPDPRSSVGRLLKERKPIHHKDLRESVGYREGVEGTVKYVDVGRARSYLAVPMLKEDRVVGGIIIYRPEVRPFTQKQIDLIATFANQAVIAIENVRLFKELEQRTAALSQSVKQLTALSEVGQAISSTLDLEKVLQTVVSRAIALSGFDGGALYEYDEREQVFHIRAAENIDASLVELYRSAPIRLGEGAVGRTGMTREPVLVPDVHEGSYQSRAREFLIRSGSRAVLAVPLLREGHILGALTVTRNTPGPFAPDVVELLKTFATQSALAIQNARLFREIADKGRQLEAASRHKSDFLASMSHELRTPLNAILGFNEMILGQIYGEVPADMLTPLTDIQTSGRHLLRLINNVLDLAKIEAGRMELALAEYSVNDTVESVRSTLRPLAADKGLEFSASLPADLPLAYGDAGRITQCLMNLAGNSLKFTKAGKVEIAVECRGDLLRYRVADTGIGIPPDKIGSLFSEFKQTDASIASEYGGTGLGLSISKKFVEMHGGRIWVESELGKGSSFFIELPLRADKGAAA